MPKTLSKGKMGGGKPKRWSGFAGWYVQCTALGCVVERLASRLGTADAWRCSGSAAHRMGGGDAILRVIAFPTVSTPFSELSFPDREVAEGALHHI